MFQISTKNKLLPIVGATQAKGVVTINLSNDSIFKFELVDKKLGIYAVTEESNEPPKKLFLVDAAKAIKLKQVSRACPDEHSDGGD